MADRTQNIIRRLQTLAPAAEFSDSDDDDEEIPREDFGPFNKRPRFIESAAQSPPQLQVRPHSPIQQSQTVTGSNTYIEQVPASGSEGYETTTDEDDDLFDIEEDDDLDDIDDLDEGEEEDPDDVEEEGGEEVNTGGEEEGDDSVAEGEHQQQHVTEPSTSVASLTGREANSGDGRNAVAVALDAATTVMLTDKTLLDCPGCLKPLRAPIYQCENGHVSCSTCCDNANGVCLSCTSTVDFTRNLAMEKLTGSILAYCKYRIFGCTEIMIYHKLVEHEQVCPQIACLCPHPSCSFVGFAEDLYDHFNICHPSSATPFSFDTAFALTCENNQKHVFLQERNEQVIFILNHDLGENNRTFYVDCIGPAKFKRVFVYQLIAKHLETYLSLQAVPEVYVKWEQHAPNKKYLTVPADFLDGNIDQFVINICIKKAHSVE
ncbi:putative E3 ubiquitin-protein ligase SINA-like 6 [Cynara cardunculus var. scolymus]|uniref:putative E3 ubiquitin-protein ligase SINA-like 6 n=1 Tax=Cynara cardunculus var. scolymus TaxID=59895 RepID=UPI000D62BE0D|nr:putative E3 ubiquitin-protein ligase SINA-like 6 [Cynara cardunculus var. scolymus]